MFQYYGSKKKLGKLYPAPEHDIIIEPFAGSAKYSLLYFEKDVRLYDKNKDIIDVWHYLQSASVNDILGLPCPKAGENIKNLNLSDIELKFLGLMIVAAPFTVNNYTVSKRSEFAQGRNPLKNIVKELYKIKHWKIAHSSYEDIENTKATWFIDPPYMNGGHKYPISNKKIDYVHLASYCKERNGQIIVCENSDANWLDFKPLATNKGVNNKTTVETIFYKNNLI